MKSIQYTIRNIPPDVDKQLRRKATKQGKSFNATIVEALEEAAGVTKKDGKYHDLDWFFGSGGIGNEEEAAFRAQRVIDQEKWQ